jgi:hypothetical protein
MDKKIIAIVSVSVLSFAFLPFAASAACSLAAGKTYYTDSVSFFKDSACHQEMTAAEMNPSTGGPATAAGYINTGNGNCRYSLAREQYTDGVSFFSDKKCTVEALDGETVSAPTAATGIAPTSGQALVAGVAMTADSQRIAALEKKVNILMSLISQILALLAKK